MRRDPYWARMIASERRAHWNRVQVMSDKALTGELRAFEVTAAQWGDRKSSVVVHFRMLCHEVQRRMMAEVRRDAR